MAPSQKIIRRPDFAGGGITAEEKERMAEHTKLWIARAFRTSPIEPDKITPAIEGLYATARALPDVVKALEGLLSALAMGPLDIAAKYGPDAHPDEPVIDAARRGQRALDLAREREA